MILILVFTGFLAGSLAALTVLAGGAGLVPALLAYGSFATTAVAITATLAAFAPQRARHPAQPPVIGPTRAHRAWSTRHGIQRLTGGLPRRPKPPGPVP